MKSGDVIERDGTKYLVIGKTFGTKTKVPVGATLSVESEQANLERDPDGKLLALTLWAPEVMGPAEGKPESLKTVVDRAKKHGVLREKVKEVGGEITYLPNESGDPATANKAEPICPKCGAKLNPLATECPECGAKFVGGISAATYGLGEVTQPDTDFYCMNCGLVLEDMPKGGKCPECGAQLVEVGDLGVLVGHKAGVEDYPDESKKLRFVAQNHYRGKSCHLDLRFEYKRGDSDYLKGYTVAHQVAGAIKEPVETIAEAKKADSNPDNWKMDLKTGLIKPRQIRGGTVRRGDLRAFRKAAEIPKDWLDVSGVTDKPDPSEPVPVGATRQYPGVFTIQEKGQVEWGAQKPWFAEFFLEGDRWKGRWAFRLVKREGKKWLSPECEEDLQQFDLKAVWEAFWAEKADVLPAGVEEEDAREGSYWVLMQPVQQQPYVLSKEAISEDWLPPRGISALPRKVRGAVPKELRYWEQDEKQALESRRKLAEEYEELGGPDMEKKEGTGQFILTRRDWKGQAVIRFGSSTTIWDLWIDGWRLSLSGDPLKDDDIAGQPASAGDKVDGKQVSDMEVGDTIDVPPGSKFNPTKETPCKLEVLDKGDVQELGIDKTHRKYEFKGKKLKGTWFFRAEDEKEPEGFWLMGKSEGPKTKEADMKEITVLIDDEGTDEKARGQGQGVGGPRQGDTGTDICICPSCGKEYPHERGTPCNKMECEECGVSLVGKEEEVAGVQAERAVIGSVAGSLSSQIKDEAEKQPELSQDLAGLNVVKPHGAMIKNGSKKAIVKAKKIKTDKPYYLIEEGTAIGIVKLAKPDKINLDEFAAKEDQHKISNDERETWWAGKKSFWYYPVVSFKALAHRVSLPSHYWTDTVVVPSTQVQEAVAEPAQEAGGQEAGAGLVIPKLPVSQHLLPGFTPFPKLPAGLPIKAFKENIAIGEKAVYLLGDEGEAVAEFPLADYASQEEAVKAVEEAMSELLAEAEEGDKAGRRIRGSKLEAIKDIKDKIVNAVEQLVKEVIGWGDYDDAGQLDWLSSEEGQKALARAYERGSAGFAFKARNGDTWWFQFTTNAFQDKEGEIFSTKSLGECVDRHKEKAVKGEFWYRHIPGTKFGDIRWEAMIGRFLGQTGPFDDTPVGNAFKGFFLANPYGHPDIAPDGWGTSHKYYFNRGDKEQRIYNWLEIAESSVLPAHVACNPWNKMVTQEVTEMNEQEKKDLEVIGGLKLVSMVEELGRSKTKELEEEGVSFKAMDVMKELKAVMDGIEDKALKERLGKVVTKLESYPYPKPGSKEEPEPEPEDLGALAAELKAIAEEIGSEEVGRIAETLKEPEPETKSAEPLTREEVFDAMKSLVEIVRTEIAQAVQTATAEAVKPVADAVKEMQQSDKEKIISTMQETPAASLDAMLKGMLGEESAKVDGRSTLAKQKPQEAPPGPGMTGVPFVDAFISGADQRQGGS